MQDEVTPRSVSGIAGYIREMREQKGLTLQQVEEATRIPRHYLEILEGGGDDRLVSDRLYMVHFLRNYAAFLEVEDETLAARFVRENRQQEPAEIIPVRERRSRKSIAMATLAILLMIAGGVYVYDPTLVGIVGGPAERIVAKSTTPPTPPEAPVQRPTPVPDTPPGADDTGSSVLQPEANETDPSEPRLVATPPAPEAAPDTPTPQAGEPAAETSDSGEPRQQTPAGNRDETDDPNPSGTPAAATVPALSAADASANYSLTITADAKSWLRVWVDDARPQDMLLAPGATRTLSAQSGFVITFGNAGGVRLTLNGEELPVAGRPGQVVRGFKLPPEP